MEERIENRSTRVSSHWVESNLSMIRSKPHQHHSENVLNSEILYRYYRQLDILHTTVHIAVHATVHITVHAMLHTVDLVTIQHIQ